jgi:hypothetical protein
MDKERVVTRHIDHKKNEADRKNRKTVLRLAQTSREGRPKAQMRIVNRNDQ